ncbi:hypothetical protein HDA32_005893 [Spinactinospora alkalitolerans]|uniref:Uncharacterized protein n=1 Tax=Spinactinospora alkalitolerans TaxID=687207 RepID=A0A852U7C4_9ACTN|nr:DUF6114 domain-containing protein [Spinactinospora alkalitolerans]NYE50773.1 hypothetical protein [Spinactinospora alkalitolerans]
MTRRTRREGRSGAPVRPWRRFRAWRRRRPFWGGFHAAMAGIVICSLPLAPVEVMIQQGIAGVPSVLMGVFLIALGLIAWATPQQRTVTGTLTMLVGLAALVMSNLGGFVIGSTFAFIGGGLMLAWQPTPRPTRRNRNRKNRKEEKRRRKDRRGRADGGEGDAAPGPAPEGPALEREPPRDRDVDTIHP